MLFLARICFNKHEWQRPSGIAPKLEGPKNYAYKYGFGHEEWLFRSGWEIDGWAYGFIQGINKAARSRIQESFDLVLYTIDAYKKRRYVATVSDVHHLSDDEAERARSTYEKNGWLNKMRREVRAVGGKPEALDSTKFAPNILNVRFRPESAFRVDNRVSQTDHPFVLRRNRYKLYGIEPRDIDSLEASFAKRRAHKGPIQLLKIFRKATPASEYSIEHRKIQKRLVALLSKTHGYDRVHVEYEYVDVTVTLPGETVLYEIKSDQNPRAVIRHALGQLLEYAFYARHRRLGLLRFVIVGRNPPTIQDREYLRILKAKYCIPLEYLTVKP